MTVETISQFLANAYEEGRPVTISGANTLAGMGLPAYPTAKPLSLLKLDQIVEDAPTDLTIAVQAGMRVRALAQTLAKNGTHVPLDAPHPSDATVGGTLAAGWLGPRRHVYGRARDVVIGTVCVLADGTIVRAGGMVVKNVAGYDLSRLYVGSFGTLAVIAQVNFKALPLPQTLRAFTMRLPEGTRERAIAQLQSLPIAPAAAIFVEGYKNAIDGEDGDDGRLFVLLEGSAPVVERATRDLRSSLGKAGVPETKIIDAGARESFERVVDAYTANVGERSITYRLSAYPDDGSQRLRHIIALAQRFELRVDAIFDVMNGDVIVRVSDLDALAFGSKIEMFDDALHDDEPTAIVIAGKHTHRPLLRVWGEPPASIERMRALKKQFDPKGILNPGRFLV